MKRFDIFYYLFIFASMAWSVLWAPAAFIGHNALAGWLWLLVFIVMLFLMLFDGVDIAKAERYTPKTERYDASQDEHRYHNTWVEAAEDRQKGDRIYYDPYYVRLYYIVKPHKRYFWGLP